MTTTRARLDTELVRRGLARSREQAGELVAAGLVAVAGRRAAKPATQVARDAPITVAEPDEPRYVSRGGHKLAGALAVFGGPEEVVPGAPDGSRGASPRGSEAPGGSPGASPRGSEAPGGLRGVSSRGSEAPGGSRGASPRGSEAPGASPRGLSVTGRQVLDAGASTGGFTDVLLRAGAAHVVAADVGYGQLAWSLRTDPRVTVMDRVNVRTLERVTPVPDLVVADLSFISLTLVLPALVAVATPDADFVLLVKPQFEVGKDRVGAGGVVRDTTDRSAAVRKVCGAAGQLGLGVLGVTASPLPGPAGNVEYFVWLRRGAPPLDEEQLSRAIEEGPS